MSVPESPFKLFDLAGLVAVVTGGAGRLGREYARTLAGAGARVAIFDLPAQATLPDDLTRIGVLSLPVDIVDRHAVQAGTGRGHPREARLEAAGHAVEVGEVALDAGSAHAAGP